MIAADVLTGIVCGAAVVIGVIFTHRLNKKPSRGNLKRSLSFTSQIMAAGSFPKATKMAPPIINSAVTYEGTCPELEDVNHLARGLMEYDRFGGVPVYAGGAWRIVPRKQAPTDAGKSSARHGRNSQALK